MCPQGLIVTVASSSVHMRHITFNLARDFIAACNKHTRLYAFYKIILLSWLLMAYIVLITLHWGHFLALWAQVLHIMAWPHGSNLMSTGDSHKKHSADELAATGGGSKQNQQDNDEHIQNFMWALFPQNILSSWNIASELRFSSQMFFIPPPSKDPLNESTDVPCTVDPPFPGTDWGWVCWSGVPTTKPVPRPYKEFTALTSIFKNNNAI